LRFAPCASRANDVPQLARRPAALSRKGSSVLTSELIAVWLAMAVLLLVYAAAEARLPDRPGALLLQEEGRLVRYLIPTKEWGQSRAAQGSSRTSHSRAASNAAKSRACHCEHVLG
jgi:hypothetical protein